MKPLPFPPDVELSLGKFQSWGAYGVEHVLLSAPDKVDANAHEQAAKVGLLAVVEKVRQETPLWELMTDLAKVEATRAKRLTAQEFFGPHFEVPSCRLATLDPEAFSLVPRFDVFSHPPTMLNPELFSLKFSSSEGAEGKTPGYAYTLLEPPHGLSEQWPQRRKLAPAEVKTQFSFLCDVLFGNLDTLDIFDWPTDCSNYFEPGLEWWGSSFWTVHAPQKNWIVSILASTTD